MPLNCPNCGEKFKFLDLYFFRLRYYQIKCKKCGSAFKLDGHIDQFGIIYFAIIAIILLILIGVIFRAISDYFILSPFVQHTFIVFIIIFISVFVIYGHAALLVWSIRRKYRGEKKTEENGEENEVKP